MPPGPEGRVLSVLNVSLSSTMGALQGPGPIWLITMSSAPRPGWPGTGTQETLSWGGVITAVMGTLGIEQARPGSPMASHFLTWSLSFLIYERSIRILTPQHCEDSKEASLVYVMCQHMENIG